mgnify:CR=1 FL=1
MIKEIKNYRKYQLYDETGWEPFDADVQKELNERALQYYYCDNIDNKNNILKSINNIFSKHRYVFVLKSKELREWYFKFTIDNPKLEDLSDVIDVIANVSFKYLNKAIEKFNPQKPNKKGELNENFTAYYFGFYPLNIKKELQEIYGMIKLPRGSFKVIFDLNKLRNTYHEAFKKYPTYEKLAELYNEKFNKNINPQKVEATLKLSEMMNCLSLDAPISNGDDDSENLTLGAVITSEEYDFDNIGNQQYYSSVADKFSKMIAQTLDKMDDIVEFKKHYKSITENQYGYFKLFYTCDTLKYVKGTDLCNELLMRSNRILKTCDTCFFHYVLHIDNDISNLNIVNTSEFKMFKELDHFFETKEYADERITIKNIFVENQNELDRLSLELENENLIFASYNYQRNNGRKKFSSEKSMASDNKAIYEHYKRIFLYNIVKNQ